MNNQVIQPLSHRIVAALAYLSVFFMPVIFPLIVWIVTSRYPFIKKHARRAFWTQLSPLLVFLVLGLFLGIFGTISGSFTSFGNFSMHFAGGWFFFTMVILTGIVALFALIYNIMMAIKIFIQ